MFDQLKQTPLLDDAQLELLREALDADELLAMLSELPQAALSKGVCLSWSNISAPRINSQR